MKTTCMLVAHGEKDEEGGGGIRTNARPLTADFSVHSQTHVTNHRLLNTLAHKLYNIYCTHPCK